MVSTVSSTLNYLTTTESSGKKVTTPPKQYEWTYKNVGQIMMDDVKWHHVDTIHKHASAIIMEGRPITDLQALLDTESIVYTVMTLRDEIGYTLLQNAIIQNRIDMVDYFIRKGADLNAPICGRPLLLAMRLGRVELVVLLLNSGADPTVSGSVCYPHQHKSSRVKFDERIQHWVTVCFGDDCAAGISMLHSSVFLCSHS